MLAALAAVLAMASFGNMALAATKGYYENNLETDAVHVLKFTTTTPYNTGNFVILESNGKYALVDAGARDIEVDKTAFYAFIDSLGIRKFEFAILTHVHTDHYLMLSQNSDFLDRYQVGRVYLQDQTGSPMASGISQMNNLISNFNTHNIPVTLWQKDTQIADMNFGDYILSVVNNHSNSAKELEYINNNNSNLNYDSLSVVVAKNGYKMLIGGDVYKMDELDMINSGEINRIGDVDVFLMNHHGLWYAEDYGSNSREYLEKINAEVFLVTNNGLTANERSIYGQYVNSNDILLSSAGNISTDFTDTRSGINVTQQGTNYRKNINREGTVIGLDNSRQPNQIYEATQPATEQPIAAVAESKNDNLQAPNTGFNNESYKLIVALIAVAGISLLVANRKKHSIKL